MYNLTMDLWWVPCTTNGAAEFKPTMLLPPREIALPSKSTKLDTVRLDLDF